MKVVLAMVMSVDGKTTKWNNPNIYGWTSKEDQKHFFSLVEKHNVIIMGRKTYDAARSVMKLSAKKLRVVITNTPEKYEKFAVRGQLEFTSDSPEELIDRLKMQGYAKVLLVGGEGINALFLKAGFVNEVWITVEPAIFGYGNSLISKEKFDVKMRLKHVRMLNKRGTLLLKYQVL